MKKKHKKYKIPKIHPTIHVVLALLLFVITVLLTRNTGAMAQWEESLFLWVYSWPEILTPIFIVITWFGSIAALAVLSTVLAFQKRFNELIRLLMASILAYELSGLAKDVWGRTRPDQALADVISRDYSYGPAFPSGHTALATAMAFVVGHYLPKKYHWVVPVWIIGVGLSRIYLGLHVPLDIIGGFAIGWFSYMLFRHVRLFPIRYGKKKKNTKLRKNKTKVRV